MKEQSNSDVKLGRFLSLVLRHDPSAAGIALDEHGWADVDELLAGVGRTGRRIDRAALERIVHGDPKRLFSFRLGAAPLEQLAGTAEAYVHTQLERGFSTLDYYKSLEGLF